MRSIFLTAASICTLCASTLQAQQPDELHLLAASSKLSPEAEKAALEADWEVVEDSNFVARYIISSNSFQTGAIYRQSSLEFRTRALVHEIAHQHFFQELTEAQRQDFVKKSLDIWHNQISSDDPSTAQTARNMYHRFINYQTSQNMSWQEFWHTEAYAITFEVLIQDGSGLPKELYPFYKNILGFRIPP